jgi:enoyl-CoA hydratase
MEQYIIFEKKGRTAYLTFNRPKALNAVNAEMIEQLENILSDLERDEEIWSVIMTGEGKAFVAGSDIAAMRDFTPAQGRAFNLHAQQVLNRLENLPKPVICAINGFALGGGLEIAMCCDIRLIAETAKIGQPEVALGIFPGWGGTSFNTTAPNSGASSAESAFPNLPVAVRAPPTITGFFIMPSPSFLFLSER